MMIPTLLVLFSTGGGPGLSQPTEATASAPPIQIVPRTTWDKRLARGAPPPLSGVTRYRGDLKDVLDGIVVHHSDFSDAPGPSAILDYHLNVNGWSDIGYHFVIGIDGTIYQGRAIDALGAHAGQSREANQAVARARQHKRGRIAVDAARKLDPDYGAIGVVLDGYFQHTPPPKVQWQALVVLLEHLCAKYRIGREHVIAHREVRARRVTARGLTVTGPTSLCPGDGGYLRLTAWRMEPFEARLHDRPASRISRRKSAPVVRPSPATPAAPSSKP